MTLPYSVGGVKMQLPIMVGAGVCKTPQSIRPYMRQDVLVGAVESGAYTPQLRAGNEGTLFYPDDWSVFNHYGFGLNAYGMPNIGFEAAAEKLPPDPVHPLIVNIAGFSVADYVDGIMAFDSHPGVSALTLNKGCPNAHDQKPLPMAYDIESLAQGLKTFSGLSITKPVWYKLSPYVTSEQLAPLAAKYPHLDFTHVPTVSDTYVGEVLDLIARYQFVRAVIFSNTLPNVIFRRELTGTLATSPNDGKAGLSGPIMKPISIDLIQKARLFLPARVDLIGSQGIISGDDACDYFEGGAAGVQCTSGPFWYGDGPRFFANLISGSARLQNYLESTQAES